MNDRTWDRFIWALMTRVLTPLLQRILRGLEWIHPLPPPSLPEHHNARSSAQPVYSGESAQISFKGMKIFPDNPDFNALLEGQRKWYDPSLSYNPEPRIIHLTQHYRDEDGELRPSRFDRSPLSDSSLEDLAAEFLRAQADVDAAPDPLEREIIAALRDAYGREIWSRCASGDLRRVFVSGSLYTIVPDGGGDIRMIPLDPDAD